MKTTFIYIIRDLTNPNVAYIGKSNNPEIRFKDHMETSIGEGNWHEERGTLDTLSAKKAWLYECWKGNKLPTISILEECSCECWREKEKAWIEKYKQDGYNLMNTLHTGRHVPRRTSGKRKPSNIEDIPNTSASTDLPFPFDRIIC